MHWIGKMNEYHITNFNIVHTGTVWNLPRVAQELKYQEFHDNNFQQLFTRSGSTNRQKIDSGEEILRNRDVVRANFFKVISDFYVDSIFSNEPSITSSAPQRQRFIDDVRRRVLDELEKAVRQYTVKGRAVLIVTEQPDGTRKLNYVKSHLYFPVVNPFDEDDIIGHILAYPYREHEPGDTLTVQIPNRIRFVLFQKDEINEVRVYDLDGSSIGALIQRVPSNVVNIYQFGQGLRDSFYEGSISPLKEIMIRLTGMSIVMNRHTKPDLQTPHNFNPQQVRMTGETRFLNKGEDDQKYEYLTFDGHLTSNEKMVEDLFNIVHVASGVPPTVFGVTVGGNESGVARERLMAAALAKIQRVRKSIEMILGGIIDDLGATKGDIKIQFVEDPLAVPLDPIAMHEAGVITDMELREKGHYPPITPEEFEAGRLREQPPVMMQPTEDDNEQINNEPNPVGQGVE